jgi:hypothetical protein
MLASLVSHRDRTILWSVIASALLHLVLLVPGVREIGPSDLFEVKKLPVVLEPMEFELVSPPERPTPTNRVSRYLSTVSSAASDDSRENDDSALPKSDGTSPFPDTPSARAGAEGGGQGELPPLPEEMGDLGEALRRSKFLDQMSPSRELSLPDMNPDFKSESSARASVGGISINTTAWDFAPYLLDLKQRIKQHWIPPLAFTALGAIHGYTKINFRIYPDGRLEGLSVVETNGHESLHRSSLNAIKGAAPFRPLPKDFPEECLDITFGFYYLLPGDEEKFLGKE